MIKVGEQTNLQSKSIIALMISLSKILTLTVILLGSSVLFGWTFDVEFLKHPFPETVSMNPATAVFFIVLAIALLLSNTRWQKTGTFLAFLILGLAGYKLTTVVFNMPAYFDTYLFSEKLKHDMGGYFSNSMAPNTALQFLFSGFAIVLLPLQIRNKYNYFQYLAIAILIISIFSISGYLYQQDKLYAVSMYTPMAIYTAMGFFIIAAAFLFALPGTGIMKIFSGPYRGSQLIRLLLPVALLLPITFSAIFELSGIFSISNGQLLHAMVLMLVLVCTILFISYKLNKESILTIEADDKLRALNAALEQKVITRTNELIIANKELALQNQANEQRAAELIIINKELEQYEHANKELKQFAYIASHELKEPLRTISNFIQIINEDYSGQLDTNALEYLQTIDDSAKRMNALISSLSHFSRLGANKKLNYVDCKEVINSVILDLSGIISSTQAKIDVSDMPKLNVYEVEFRQLFQNLITNAIKFQKNGSLPRIQIQYKRTNENNQFSVSDNGIGISPTHFERIFDIFQRLHPGEEQFEGKGIGLAFCKKIVQLHKGEIWVESELGKGTTFYFTISQHLAV